MLAALLAGCTSFGGDVSLPANAPRVLGPDRDRDHVRLVRGLRRRGPRAAAPAAADRRDEPPGHGHRPAGRGLPGDDPQLARGQCLRPSQRPPLRDARTPGARQRHLRGGGRALARDRPRHPSPCLAAQRAAGALGPDRARGRERAERCRGGRRGAKPGALRAGELLAGAGARGGPDGREGSGPCGLRPLRRAPLPDGPRPLGHELGRLDGGAECLASAHRRPRGAGVAGRAALRDTGNRGDGAPRLS